MKGDHSPCFDHLSSIQSRNTKGHLLNCSFHRRSTNVVSSPFTILNIYHSLTRPLDAIFQRNLQSYSQKFCSLKYLLNKYSRICVCLYETLIDPDNMHHIPPSHYRGPYRQTRGPLTLMLSCTKVHSLQDLPLHAPAANILPKIHIFFHVTGGRRSHYIRRSSPTWLTWDVIINGQNCQI